MERFVTHCCKVIDILEDFDLKMYKLMWIIYPIVPIILLLYFLFK